MSFLVSLCFLDITYYSFSFVDCDMFMRYIGGAVGHQDVSELEICDVETSKMEVDVDPLKMLAVMGKVVTPKKTYPTKRDPILAMIVMMKILGTGTQMMTMVHISVMTMMNSSRFGAPKTIFHCELHVILNLDLFR